MSIAVVFPGQGSQSVGMLKDLAAHYPIVIEIFNQASQVLDYDLWQLVQSDTKDTLNTTHVTQPAMLAAGFAVWRVWQTKGGTTPSIVAGHSLGEYTALVCAGSLDFSDTIALVAERGLLMAKAVPSGTGAMAAIVGMNAQEVEQVCHEATEGNTVVTPANYNSPAQIVVAGHKVAVERCMTLAKERGAKLAKVLPVSAPSHCGLMKPAAEQLALRLKKIQIQPPVIPVINNVDVVTPEDPDLIRDSLIRQLYNPLRWVEIINKIAHSDVHRLIECGPGKVLVGLNKRIIRSMTALPVYDPTTLECALQD